MKKGFAIGAIAVVVLMIACLSGCESKQPETVQPRQIENNEAIAEDEYEFVIEEAQYYYTTDGDGLIYYFDGYGENGDGRRAVGLGRGYSGIFCICGSYTNKCDFDIDLNQVFRGVLCINGRYEEYSAIAAVSDTDIVAPQETKKFLIYGCATQSMYDNCTTTDFKFGFSINNATASIDDLPKVYKIGYNWASDK